MSESFPSPEQPLNQPEHLDTAPSPRIWVADITAYESDILHGEWISAAQPYTVLRQDVRRLLARSPIPDAQRFAIVDSDNFDGITLDQDTDLRIVSHLGLSIKEHGRPYSHWVGHLGLDNLDQAEETFKEAYIGTFESTAVVVDYVWYLLGYGYQYDAAIQQIPEALNAALTVNWELASKVLLERIHVAVGNDSKHYAYWNL